MCPCGRIAVSIGHADSPRALSAKESNDGSALGRDRHCRRQPRQRNVLPGLGGAAPWARPAHHGVIGIEGCSRSGESIKLGRSSSQRCQSESLARTVARPQCRIRFQSISVYGSPVEDGRFRVSANHRGQSDRLCSGFRPLQQRPVPKRKLKGNTVEARAEPCAIRGRLDRTSACGSCSLRLRRTAAARVALGQRYGPGQRGAAAIPHRRPIPSMPLTTV